MRYCVGRGYRYARHPYSPLKIASDVRVNGSQTGGVIRDQGKKQRRVGPGPNLCLDLPAGEGRCVSLVAISQSGKMRQTSSAVQSQRAIEAGCENGASRKMKQDQSVTVAAKTSYRCP